jgi:hypothetical protein
MKRLKGGMFGMMYGYKDDTMNELFEDDNLLDPELIRAIKDMKRAGWEMDTLESLFCVRLRNSGRGEYIPAFKRQFQLVKGKK